MLFSQVTAPTSKWISDAQGSDAGIKMALLLSVGVGVEFEEFFSHVALLIACVIVFTISLSFVFLFSFLVTSCLLIDFNQF